MKWLITSIWKEQIIIMTLTREQRWFAILPITEGWKDLQASIKNTLFLCAWLRPTVHFILLSKQSAYEMNTSLLHNTQ